MISLLFFTYFLIFETFSLAYDSYTQGFFANILESSNTDTLFSTKAQENIFIGLEQRSCHSYSPSWPLCVLAT
jgi:hypothetical protein